MSSQTMARWSMPRVLMGLLHLREKLIDLFQKTILVLDGDVVAGVDLHHPQARVRGLHLRRRLRRVHVRAPAAHGEDRAAHLADERPHVHAEVWPFTGFQHFPELVAE